MESSSFVVNCRQNVDYRFRRDTRSETRVRFQSAVAPRQISAQLGASRGAEGSRERPIFLPGRPGSPLSLGLERPSCHLWQAAQRRGSPTATTLVGSA